MDLKSFREFMWNKRRNEYLKLKYTERYKNDPEPWETIYKDVNDTAVGVLTERAVVIASPQLHDSTGVDCKQSIGENSLGYV
jgi:hypothetical protein